MKSPKISIIVAVDEKRGIGRNNKIPWHIKEDLIRLAKMTQNRIVILGRRTYESMAGYYVRSGRPMPAKEYIVVTRQRGFKSVRSNTSAVHSIGGAVKRAKESGEKEVFIIGGSEIFNQAILLADKIYLTLVKGDFNCDTFFPDYSNFKKVLGSKKSKSGGYEFERRILKK